jgi:hypothetical protein
MYSYRPVVSPVHTLLQNRSSCIHKDKKRMLSALSGVLGYETLPADVGAKSFYDLKASLPGKDKVYDFVSVNSSLIDSRMNADVFMGCSRN